MTDRSPDQPITPNALMGLVDEIKAIRRRVVELDLDVDAPWSCDLEECAARLRAAAHDLEEARNRVVDERTSARRARATA